MSNVDLGLKVNAKIGQKLTTINLIEKGKNLPNKIISTKDFVKVLSSITDEDKREESPLFPSDYGTKKMLKNNNDYYFLVTTPPGRKEIKYSSLDINAITYIDSDEYEEQIEYESDEYYELSDYLTEYNIYDQEDFVVNPYLPSLVWFIHVRHEVTDDTYRFVKDRIYSKEGVILSMKDEIFPAPLSNIYPDDRVCWGDVEIPSLTIPGLMALERIFFNVYSNMDLEATSTKTININGYDYKAKFLHLVQSQSIYNTQGKDSAASYMNNLIRGARPFSTQTIEEVWDGFTR